MSFIYNCITEHLIKLANHVLFPTQVNKMSLNEHTEDGDPLKFTLCSKDPHQEGVSFIIQTPSMEARNKWVSNIRAILETQLDFLRGTAFLLFHHKICLAS